MSETGISETALGLKALKDGSAIARLRSGRTMTLRTADKLLACMAAERARLAGARAEAGLRGGTGRDQHGAAPAKARPSAAARLARYLARPWHRRRTP